MNSISQDEFKVSACPGLAKPCFDNELGPKKLKIMNNVACVAADSFPFSGDAEIDQANEKRASEGARLG